ncbi:MAG: hypothetical protein BroJett009_23790 [Armatimonadota bacterium]|nr:MAG: hypothetical protein BroJett009_23790 [Armatimonadota bacterium]
MGLETISTYVPKGPTGRKPKAKGEAQEPIAGWPPSSVRATPSPCGAPASPQSPGAPPSFDPKHATETPPANNLKLPTGNPNTSAYYLNASAGNLKAFVNNRNASADNRNTSADDLNASADNRKTSANHLITSTDNPNAPADPPTASGDEANAPPQTLRSPPDQERTRDSKPPQPMSPQAERAEKRGFPTADPKPPQPNAPKGPTGRNPKAKGEALEPIAGLRQSPVRATPDSPRRRPPPTSKPPPAPRLLLPRSSPLPAQVPKELNQPQTRSRATTGAMGRGISILPATKASHLNGRNAGPS